MAGFDGRITFEGNADVARSSLDVAIKHAQTLRAWKETQGISAVTKAYDLGDGVNAVVVDLQNIRAIHIIAPPPESAYEDPIHHASLKLLGQIGILDSVPGVVLNSIIEPIKIQRKNAKKETVEVEADAIKNFRLTPYAEQRYDLITARRRLAVKESVVHQSLNDHSGRIYSVHRNTRPSNFSGSMRELVQLWMGMGRRADPMWEMKWAKQNKKSPLMKDELELSALTAPESAFGLYNAPEVLTGEDPNAVKIEHDYRFFTTHGISFDKTGRAWLVEISMRGVHAMPLYLDPVSVFPQGKQQYLAVCPELEPIFDRYRGVPIGVAFPRNQEVFDRLKRAGEIVELLDAEGMSPFYSKGMFSSAIGWSFNSRGTEAHNCCTGVEGIYQTGEHYCVYIDIRQEDPLPKLDEERAELARLLRLTSASDIRKLLRMEQGEIESLLFTAGRDPEEAKEAFDNLVVKPNLRGQARLKLVRKGILYHPSSKFGMLKFPEPLIGGLISFDFTPLEPPTNPPEFCEAPVFVCHIDDTVEVVYYCRDVRHRSDVQITDTREPCQWTGQWEYKVESGGANLAGHFYSTRWDFRQEIYPSESKTVTTGTRIGVTNRAEAEYFFSRCVYVTAHVNILLRTVHKGFDNNSVRISVAVPLYARDAYYMAVEKSRRKFAETESLSTARIQAAGVQKWQLYNFVFHWFGGCGSPMFDIGPTTCKAKKTHEYRIPACFDDMPSNFFYWVCPEYAPRGMQTIVTAPWGDAIIGSAEWGGPTLPTPYSRQIKPPEIEYEGEVWLAIDGRTGAVQTFRNRISGPDIESYNLGMTSWWWIKSPDDYGNVAWGGAMYNCLGSELVNCTKQIDGGDTMSIGTPFAMWATPWACYTGVVR